MRSVLNSRDDFILGGRNVHVRPIYYQSVIMEQSSHDKLLSHLQSNGCLYHDYPGQVTVMYSASIPLPDLARQHFENFHIFQDLECHQVKPLPYTITFQPDTYRYKRFIDPFNRHFLVLEFTGDKDTNPLIQENGYLQSSGLAWEYGEYTPFLKIQELEANDPTPNYPLPTFPLSFDKVNYQVLGEVINTPL